MTDQYADNRLTQDPKFYAHRSPLFHSLVDSIHHFDALDIQRVKCLMEDRHERILADGDMRN